MIQKISDWVDMKSAAGVAVIILLGICLILSSKAVYELNNRNNQYGDSETMMNITDRLKYSRNQARRQQGLIDHIHRAAWENILDIENLEFNYGLLRNYVSISNCPKNWIEFEGTCFFISNSIQKTNWNRSSNECKKLNENAEMAMKTSEDQNKFIILQAMGNNSHLNPELWIGGAKKDEQWKWKDGTNIKKELSNQIKDEHYSHECLLLSKKHETLNISFLSGHCYDTYQYVCQLVPEVSCQDGWLARGNNCYLFSTSQANWEDARKHCQEFGDDSDLFTASTASELSFKKNKDNDDYYYYSWGEEHWVGGHDELGNGNFKWLNVTPIPEDSSYWQYGDGPSRDVKRRCVGAVYQHERLKLTQSKCEIFMYYICKKGSESFKGIDHHIRSIDSKVSSLSNKEKENSETMEIMDENNKKDFSVLSNKVNDIEDRIGAMEERQNKEVTAGTTTSTPSKTTKKT